MKLKNYFIIGVAVSFALTSCKKEDDAPKSELDAPYSEVSVEQNKTNIEDNGIAMVNEMDALMQSEAMDVAESFSSIAETLFDNNPALSEMAPMQTMSLLSDDNFDAQKVIAGLKSATEGTPTQISDEWADAVGTYAWSATNEIWNFTAGGDAIVFQFPGSETDASNTAEFKVSNFSYMDVTANTYEMELEGITELPTSLNAALSYNGSELISYSFSASYQPDGMPTALNTSLDVDGFVFAVEALHTLNKFGSVKYSFKHNDNTLIEAYADASGNWSQENIDANTETHTETYTDQWGEYTSEWTEVYIENILKNANAHIQLMNIKVVGMIDFAQLGKRMRAIEDKEYTEEEYEKEFAKALNDYAKLGVVYADNGKKIAVAEAYAFEDTDEWGSYWGTDLRFIFADESTVSAEMYFETEFDNLIEEINDLIDDFNAEYGAEIDPVE